MKYRIWTAAAILAAASFSNAQVEVQDLKISPETGDTSTPAVKPVKTNNTAELYYQLQLLQQEVLQLRGMVEEQSHEIKKLKQQRLDDYLDLDRRVSQLSKDGTASANATPVSATNNSSSSVAVPAQDEMTHYKDAMNLVLRQQKYDEAIEALKEHLELFPDSKFAANSQYWLGEVYLQKQELEEARQWFSRVLSQYPDHTKAPDAQYKLGTVYHMLGDDTLAKTTLEKVAQSDANAARLAKDYLANNF